MKNPLTPILNYISRNFSKDPSKMLIVTGVMGWTLSSVAQIGAILINPKISKEKKSFLIPQEFADALVNIGMFFLFTQVAKKTVSKLFTTGKFKTASTKKFIEQNQNLFKDKIGKLDFNIESILPKDKGNLYSNYKLTKAFAETVATVGAGVISSNIITPIVRNEMASAMQKNYINYKKSTENQEIKKPEIKLQSVPAPNFKSYGMRI